MPRTRTWIVLGLVLAAAAARLVPHVPNLTPVEAMALFGGAYLGDRRTALLAPLAALFASDLVLGYAVYGYGLVYPGMAFVYLAVAAIAVLGGRLGPRAGAGRVALGTLGAASLFFLVTNFGVWLTGGLYPHSLEGLLACYTAALPFFRYTLAGTVLYSALLFGGFALARRRFPARPRSGSGLRGVTP